MQKNVHKNLSIFGEGNIVAHELDWVKSKEQGEISSLEINQPLHYLIGSDLVYEHQHPDALLWVLCHVCPPPKESSTTTEIIIASDRRGRVGLKKFLALAEAHFSVEQLDTSMVDERAKEHVSIVKMVRKSED